MSVGKTRISPVSKDNVGLQQHLPVGFGAQFLHALGYYTSDTTGVLIIGAFPDDNLVLDSGGRFSRHIELLRALPRLHLKLLSLFLNDALCLQVLSHSEPRFR
jgi:hypothetical protein